MSGKMRYRSIEAMLGLVSEPNRTRCLQLLAENRSLFQRVQGSTHNHQAWVGGYFDHVQEGMNIVITLYQTFDELRPLPFTLSDALLAFYLHDIEKPWKYQLGADGHLENRPGMETKADHHAFRLKLIEEHGIVLSEDAANGFKYAEGELSDYSSRERKMHPIAALVHAADVTSARLWHQHPLEHADPWKGARRIRDT